MKHEYLVDLLKQNKTVIVPNLGAFSNNENPTHPYLFNEYLKFNDGMMAKHIAAKEGVSMEAAGDVIDKFTNELKDILAGGKEVVIPGIGTLTKKDGKIHLSSPFAAVTAEKKSPPVTEQKPEPPKVEIPKVVTPPVVEKPKVEPPKVEVPKAVTPPVVEKPKVEVPKVTPPVVEKPKIEPPKVEAPKAVTPPVVEKPKVEPPKVVTPPVVEKPKVEPPKAEVTETKKDDLNSKKKEAKTKEPKPKKKRRKLVWLIILLLLLGGGGTAGYLYKDEIMKMVGMGEEEKTAGKKEDKSKESDKETTETTTSEETIPADTAVADTTAVETVVENTPVEEKEPVKTEEPKQEIKVVADTSTPGTYYVIVGCFTYPEHADNMTAKVSAAGLTPTNVGTFGGLIHIAAGSASDLPGALQQATNIRSTFPKVWILKR